MLCMLLRMTCQERHDKTIYETQGVYGVEGVT
jgi:hypothetical protein